MHICSIPVNMIEESMATTIATFQIKIHCATFRFLNLPKQQFKFKHNKKLERTHPTLILSILGENIHSIFVRTDTMDN